MRERDLERATQLFAEIKKVQDCFADHEKVGKHLRLFFQLPCTNQVDGGPEEDWSDVAPALHLQHDALHMRTNKLINTMLGEQLTNLKAELRKLGVKLEDETTLPASPKGKAKQKLLTGPKEKE